MPSVTSNYRQEISHLTPGATNNEKELDVCFMNHSDLETTRLLSDDLPQNKPEGVILPTQEALPLISFILFAIFNIIPAILSCTMVSDTHCLRLKIFENSYFFRWTFVLGNLVSTVACMGTIELVYSYMKKRFLVPEYLRNMTLLNINYAIGLISAVSFFLYVALEMEVATMQIDIDENTMLKLHLMTVLAYNTINFHLLCTLEKENDPKAQIFLFKLKRAIFICGGVIVGFSVCCDFLTSATIWSQYHHILSTASAISAMIAVFANQIYWGLYCVDIKLIENQYQSKFAEKYFITKKAKQNKAYLLKYI